MIDRGAAAAVSLADYFERLLAERRRAPRQDIPAELIRAEAAGDRLTPAELIAQSSGLLISGFETTIGLIGLHPLRRFHDLGRDARIFAVGYAGFLLGSGRRSARTAFS